MDHNPHSAGEVFLLDDEPLVRETLTRTLSRAGFDVICFADGPALLTVARTRSPACIILDVHIPGKSGLDILKELNTEAYPAPIFIISGQGDIRTAVSAIKSGAFDFIEKPIVGSTLVKTVREAIQRYSNNEERTSDNPPLNFPGLKPLTRREQDVLALCMAGATNKEAGRRLGNSSRTIEKHRASIMKKLGAKNAADLVRIVLSQRS
jgi:FixJ family two-component response regulator